MRRSGTAVSLAALLVAGGVTACGGSRGKTQTHGLTASPGRIVFVRAGDIWVMEADGTRQHPLTRTRTEEGWPSWSPRADRIAFTRDGQIFVMRADGSRVRRLVHSRADDSSPSWSPDGRWIAFSRQFDPDCLEPCPTAIFVVHVDGSGLRRLSPVLDSAADFPSWSPDSRRLAFGTGGVAVVGMNGRGLRVISNHGDDADPAWSPDGQQIALVTSAHDSAEIAVMTAAGKKRSLLTSPPRTGEAPTWAPDGTEIAFGRVRRGREFIVVMSADGETQRSLGRGQEPDWSRSSS